MAGPVWKAERSPEYIVPIVYFHNQIAATHYGLVAHKSLAATHYGLVAHKSLYCAELIFSYRLICLNILSLGCQLPFWLSEWCYILQRSCDYTIIIIITAGLYAPSIKLGKKDVNIINKKACTNVLTVLNGQCCTTGLDTTMCMVSSAQSRTTVNICNSSKRKSKKLKIMSAD